MALQFGRSEADPAVLQVAVVQAEQRRADRQVDAELQRMEAEQRRADAAAAAAAQARQRMERDARRASARQARHEVARRVTSTLGQRSVFVVPLLLITGFAVFGQVGYGVEHYTAPAADPTYKLIVAVGAAVAIESISNYVQWLSHRARLAGATARAGKLSRGSYGIAAVVAGINYAHFAEPGMTATPAALVFAAFSLSSPILWGLYTRHAEEEKRAEDGTLDCRGAVFSAERWRQFPILTWQARRYSILRNISNPTEAWNAFLAEHQRVVKTRRIERRQRSAQRSGPRSGGWSSPWSGLWSTRRPDHGEDHMAAADHGPVSGPAGGPASGPGTGPDHSTPDGPDRGPAGGPPVVRPAVVRPAAAVVRPVRTAVARIPQPPADVSPEEQAELQDLATDWATRQEAVPGWRKILGATDDAGRPMFPGISHPSAKKAAAAARQQRGWPVDEAAAQ